MNQKEIDRQARWSEISQNIDHELHKACNEFGEAYVKVQELMASTILEAVDYQVVEQIREFVSHAFASLDAYQFYVGEMLSEFPRTSRR